jgi:hypothetical protein
MVDEKLAGPTSVYTKHDQDDLTERENIWRAHGMPEETQAFADMLYRNNVAPEQILFDAGARIMRMTAPTSPLPTLLRNSSVKAMNLLTATATLDPRP